jgi:2-hydroxy-3-keto-5-methylthiopentenyl-1-phosphate phosphatase
MKSDQIRIFVDFDGTVSDKDVGHHIFQKFLRPELIEQGWHQAILDEWKAGLISSQECLSLECEHSVISEKEMNTELDRFALTRGFVETADYCKNQGIPLMILSDGLDYYIEYILGKYGLSDVEYRANHMYFHNGSLKVEFPYIDKGCGRCGNCKRWHIDTLREDGDFVIYVGDGYSDRFAIQSADVAFARYDLAEYCEEQGLTYIPFNNFYNILNYLEELNGNV